MMAYFLVIMSFFFQGMLLYTIFNEVVVENLKWQNGIMKTGHTPLNLFQPPPGGDQCNEGGSLCFAEDGVYTCAPPSVQLTGRWEELDVNGDGVWTREEVLSERKRLKCRYVVDPLEVFDVFHNFLLKRRALLWLHPDVVAGKMIHKPYFEYAMGDLIMCGYRNEEMCPNLLERGVFDAPLEFGTAPRVGTTIDSALTYCRELLRDGGTCQTTLPSTYSVWRIDSAQQCGAEEYEKFTYTHPRDGGIKSLLTVDYAARRAFERSKTPVFLIFKGLIVAIWILAMIYELKNDIIVFTWVLRFPDAEQFGENAVKVVHDPRSTEDDHVMYIIQGITKWHRMTVGVLNVGRLIITFLLFLIGVSFLSKQTNYIGALMDGVALLFIVEIANLLYLFVLRTDIREQTEGIEPMHVEMFGIDWLNRRPAVMDTLWLVVAFSVVAVAMHTFYVQVSVPVSDSLECACLSRGDKCFEAEAFSSDFWRKYWLKDVPRVFDEIEKMKGGASLTRVTSTDVGSGAAVAMRATALPSRQANQSHLTGSRTASTLATTGKVVVSRFLRKGRSAKGGAKLSKAFGHF